jgi:regulator of protease activity HflC (stomatin/prohibitin superfamily)
VIDAKQREEEKRAEAEGQDEAEDLAAEAEQKRQEDEEAVAARAVGDANYRRKPTKLSKKRQRREEQRRRALTGEEWSADALLCWSFEAKVFKKKRATRECTPPRFQGHG